MPEVKTETAKIKQKNIFSIAKEVNRQSTEILEYLKRIGVDIGGIMSKVDDTIYKKILGHFKTDIEGAEKHKQKLIEFKKKHKTVEISEIEEDLKKEKEKKLQEQQELQKRREEDERRKRARELLELVGLAGRGEHRPQRLSAGEQQRVAIARALANDPAIILADEPTGNLDTENKYEIVRLLGNLNINRGTTIIMVTHDGHVASHTERMLLLQDGRITKEKQGLHLTKKRLMCPYCGNKIQPDDKRCPSCKKRL